MVIIYPKKIITIRLTIYASRWDRCGVVCHCLLDSFYARITLHTISRVVISRSILTAGRQDYKIVSYQRKETIM